MTVQVDAQCGRCETKFVVSIGAALQCPNPECGAVLLEREGNLVWLRPAELEAEKVLLLEQAALSGHERE